jgi:hypothetical protein
VRVFTAFGLHLTRGVDCLCYSDASISENGQDDDVVAKRDTFLAPDETPSLGHAFDAALGFDALFDNGTHTMLGHPVIFETAKLRICNDVQVTIPSYSATNIIAYYEYVIKLPHVRTSTNHESNSHEDPGALDPTVGSYISLPVDLGGKLTTVRSSSPLPFPPSSSKYLAIRWRRVCARARVRTEHVIALHRLPQHADGSLAERGWKRRLLRLGEGKHQCRAFVEPGSDKAHDVTRPVLPRQDEGTNAKHGGSVSASKCGLS